MVSTHIAWGCYSHICLYKVIPTTFTLRRGYTVPTLRVFIKVDIPRGLGISRLIRFYYEKG